MSLIVDRRDLDFVLFEMLGAAKLAGTDRFAGFDPATMSQILDAAQTLGEEVLLPIAAQVDADEPRYVAGGVEQPAVVGEALAALAEAGFFSLTFDEALGGLGAPWILHTAAMGILVAANAPVTNYAFLTTAAANLLSTFGSDDLKARYLPQMIAGRWFGTMALSEPQAGSSLGDIRTMARPRPDGTFAITGTKMWISGGDQAITDNIVHMVLAKLPDAAPGAKGISLFVVPKMLSDEAGQVTASNNVSLAGLNHKMGQRATTNTLLNFGEAGETIGWMIGTPGRGLEYMFHMMNEARIGVGHASAMAALAGYLYAADYALSRPQGRALTDRNPANPQVPIIEHVDIRRMLLGQKAAVEGAQALCLYAAGLVDEIASADDAATRDRARATLELLTPVVKSWPSEHCLEANKWAMQILGGYGYTRDYPLERLYRDNRLNHIHEGTFGIQGQDLLGRKIGADGGATLGAFLATIRAEIDRAGAALATEAAGLERGVQAVEGAVAALLGCADPERRMANATVFLDAFGDVVIGWIWLWQARLAEAALAGAALGHGDRLFYEGKRQACRYFFHHEMPLAIARLGICESLVAPALDTSPALFGA